MYLFFIIFLVFSDTSTAEDKVSTLSRNLYTSDTVPFPRRRKT